MRAHVRVVVRTKPTDNVASTFRILPNNVVSISRPAGAGARGSAALKSTTSSADVAVKEEVFTYPVSAILHNASQESVYNAAVSDLVDSALQGYSCTLLCYGQCGAGKTYTMFGTDTFPTRGCVQRAIEVLFEAIRNCTDRRYNVRMTFVEVYNEQVFDLLGKGASAAATAEMAKRPGRDRSNECNLRRPVGGSHSYNERAASPSARGGDKATVTINGDGSVVLRGVDERQCATESDALTAVFEGVNRRLTGSNALNSASSRSHAVLTIVVTSTSLLDSDAVTLVSRMNFVDFAGSERAQATSTEAEKQEAHKINRSLIMLEQVILAVFSSRSRHVPFRQSKLTMLLKDSLGGGTMTTIIANIWPQQEHMDATLGTLNFAKRLMRIESNPTPNVTLDAEAQIRVLQKQVNSLKSELRMQDQFAGRVAIPTAPLESDEINGARDIVMAYVEGSVPQIRVSCVREMYACFSVFKTLLLDMESQLRNTERSTTPPPTNTQRSQQKLRNASRQAGSQEQRESPRHVNSVVDGTAGIGVGIADRASTALGDMFHQQQLQQQQQGPPPPPQLPQQGRHSAVGPHDAFGSPSAPSTDRRGSGATAVGTSLTPGGGGPAVSPEFPAVLNAMPRYKFNGPSESTSMMERDFAKDRMRVPGNRASVGEYRADASVLQATAAVSPLSPGTGSKPLMRLESVTRDKRAAFEIYKQTSSGACHIQAINSAQEKLVRKNEEVLQLRLKVKDIEDVMGSQVIGDFKKSSNNTSSVTPLPLLVAHGGPTQYVFNEANTDSNGEAGIEDSMAANDGPPRLPEGLGVAEVERLVSMKPAERRLYLRHAATALTRAKTEQSLLTAQLDRLREEFMNSFNYWHQMSLQSLVPQQVDKVQVPMLKMDAIAGIRRPTVSRDINSRYGENSECTDTLGSIRLEHLEPDSTALYETHRRVNGKPSSRV